MHESLRFRAYCGDVLQFDEVLPDREARRVGSVRFDDTHLIYKNVPSKFRSTLIVRDSAVAGWHFTVSVKQNLLLIDPPDEYIPERKLVYEGGIQDNNFEVSPDSSFEIEDTVVRFEWGNPDSPSRPSSATPDPATENFTVVELPKEELKKVSYREGIILSDAIERLVDSLIKNDKQAVHDRQAAFERTIAALESGIKDVDALVVDARSGKGLTGGCRVVAPRTTSASTATIQPSHRLLNAAVESRQPQWVDYSKPNDASKYSIPPNLIKWAVCVPFTNKTLRGQAIYLAGMDQWGEAQLKQVAKFAVLAAQTLSGLVENLELNRNQKRLASFVPHILSQMIGKEDFEKAIEPMAREIVVLFCDLRGFSSKVQKAELIKAQPAALAEVQAALADMTLSVAREGGVIGSFQGDAIMAFWGWPWQPRDKAMLAAIRAGTEIVDKFHRKLKKSDNSFRCGIGLAAGEAMVGRMGTEDQSTLSVFGTVVNRASRLESLTKTFRVEAIVDESVAEWVRQNQHESHRYSVRKLAKVLPAGFEETVALHRLIDAGPTQRDPNDTDLWVETHWDDIFAAIFEKKDWNKAKELLEALDRQNDADHTPRLLLDELKKHNYIAPMDWRGYFAFEK